MTSLSALEQALSSRRTERLIFFAFDLIHLDGHDLTRVPLIQRKKALRELLGTVPENSPLQLSHYLIGRGAALFAEACRMGLGGIVCKRTDATYRPGRSTTWLKVKSRLQGEFIIVGYTESKAAGGLGALLLAERVGGGLAFVGKVGTGFSEREAEMLRAHLRVLRCDDPCLPVPKEFRRASANWTEPKLISAVRYAARTADGYLRHPVFEGLIARCAGTEAMNRASLVIAVLCLASLPEAGCATDEFLSPLSGFGQTDDYGQTPPYGYSESLRVPRPYGSPWMGQRPYWNAPPSRVFSPDPGVVCDQRKAVCYKWHNGSGEWRPDPSDTRDNFGKKAASRLDQ